MRKSRNIRYLFGEGVHGLFRHGFMSFAAICVTVACLIIIGSFGMILYNLGLMVRQLDEQNRILVIIDESYTSAEAKSVGSQINMNANVKQAVFVSRSEALESFEQKQGVEAFEGVDANNLRDRYVVTLVDNAKMEQTNAELMNIQGVAKIVAHPEIADGIVMIQQVLNVVSFAIIIVLLVVSLFIISNTIKLAMYDRRDEIAIMKMVGATDSFIRFPYVIEGFLIGLISGVLAFFIEWGLYDLIARAIGNLNGSFGLFIVVPFQDVLWIVAATFGLTGLLIGVLGSVFSIRKFLDV